LKDIFLKVYLLGLIFSTIIILYVSFNEKLLEKLLDEISFIKTKEYRDYFLIVSLVFVVLSSWSSILLINPLKRSGNNNDRKN